jgi:hypothetical protein
MTNESNDSRATAYEFESINRQGTGPLPPG